MGNHKNNIFLGNPKNSVHPWFPYSLNVFLYLRVFPHKSGHITYHEVKLNLQPDHQYDHLIHKWQCVLTASILLAWETADVLLPGAPWFISTSIWCSRGFATRSSFWHSLSFGSATVSTGQWSRQMRPLTKFQVWVLPPAAQCSVWHTKFFRKFLPEVHTKQPCLVPFNFKYHQSIHIKASIFLFVK